jgi:hypothetical protein
MMEHICKFCGSVIPDSSVTTVYWSKALGSKKQLQLICDKSNHKYYVESPSKGEGE